jgi:methylenetetrahydrofolate reductase (NADPH)
VSKVFVSFITGKIKKLPFSEGTMNIESEDINDVLVQLNSNKLLTINSQPRVNGAKSTDPKFGWGPEQGYVYQKAYFELFVHPSIIKDLVTYLEQFPDITFQAMNLSGDKYQNVTDDDVNAVTWGVFKGKEII